MVDENELKAICVGAALLALVVVAGAAYFITKVTTESDTKQMQICMDSNGMWYNSNCLYPRKPQ